MPEIAENRDELIGLVATLAVENGEVEGLRDLLRQEQPVLHLYDRFVAVDQRLAGARAAAPPLPVDDALLARFGLATERRRPPARLWLAAGAAAAVIAGAVALLPSTPATTAYAPAGATAGESSLPESFTLPDGEQLAKRPDTELAGLPCRIFASASGGTRVLACRGSDGTSQTVLLEP